MTARQIAMSNGIKSCTYYARLRRGWHPHVAAMKRPQAYHREWEPQRMKAA